MNLHDYHQLRPLPYLGGELFVKAGARGFADPQYELLAQNIEPFGQQALELNPGVGTVVLKLLQMGLEVTALETSKAAQRCLEASFSTKIQLSIEPPWQTIPDSADLVALVLPANRGSKYVELSLLGAARALREGGRLWVAGSKEKGFESYFARAQALLGYGLVVAKSGPVRVGLLEKEKPSQQIEDVWESFSTKLLGQDFDFDYLPGVFSAGHVDAGTQMLLEQLPLDLGQVLDMGGGYGALSLPLAGRSKSITLLEDDLLSVISAEKSFAKNGLGGQILQSDVDSALTKTARFTTVVSNPPFHVGGLVVLDTAIAFLEAAQARLVPGGTFYLVANHFLPYEALLEKLFSEVETLKVASHKVILARN